MPCQLRHELIRILLNPTCKCNKIITELRTRHCWQKLALAIELFPQIRTAKFQFENNNGKLEQRGTAKFNEKSSPHVITLAAPRGLKTELHNELKKVPSVIIRSARTILQGEKERGAEAENSVRQSRSSELSIIFTFAGETRLLRPVSILAALLYYSKTRSFPPVHLNSSSGGFEWLKFRNHSANNQLVNYVTPLLFSRSRVVAFLHPQLGGCSWYNCIWLEFWRFRLSNNERLQILKIDYWSMILPVHGLNNEKSKARWKTFLEI